LFLFTIIIIDIYCIAPIKTGDFVLFPSVKYSSAEQQCCVFLFVFDILMACADAVWFNLCDEQLTCRNSPEAEIDFLIINFEIHPAVQNFQVELRY